MASAYYATALQAEQILLLPRITIQVRRENETEKHISDCNGTVSGSNSLYINMPMTPYKRHRMRKSFRNAMRAKVSFSHF